MTEPMSDDAYWDYLAEDRAHAKRIGSFEAALKRVLAKDEEEDES